MSHDAELHKDRQITTEHGKPSLYPPTARKSTNILWRNAPIAEISGEGSPPEAQITRRAEPSQHADFITGMAVDSLACKNWRGGFGLYPRLFVLEFLLLSFRGLLRIYPLTIPLFFNN